MNLEIEYLKKADKFFIKNSPTLSKEKYYRIRSGKVRILFELIDGQITVTAIVNDVEFRGNVY